MAEDERRRVRADYMRAYTRLNAGHINARRRVVRLARKAEIRTVRRAWEDRNREHVRAIWRAAHHRHKGSRKVQNKAWRLKNQPTIKARERAWRVANPEKQRLSKVSRLYGLSAEGYQSLVDLQKGVCAICGKPEVKRDKRTGRTQRLAVDHDHETGLIRGLLCGACNCAIGHFDDDCARMARAILYLNKYANNKTH